MNKEEQDTVDLIFSTVDLDGDRKVHVRAGGPDDGFAPGHVLVTFERPIPEDGYDIEQIRRSALTERDGKLVTNIKLEQSSARALADLIVYEVMAANRKGGNGSTD